MLLISINPRFAKMILCGSKTVELRRCSPRNPSILWVALYATTPERSIIGIARAQDIIVATPDELWNLVFDKCGINRDQYDRYYTGSKRAVGIFLDQYYSFSSPMHLDYLRHLWPGFHPPRSFLYLTSKQSDDVFANTQYNY